MNLKIKWLLKNSANPSMATVKLYSESPIFNKEILVEHNSLTNLEIPDSLHTKEYTLKISRYEKLKPNSTTLENWIIIDKIIVDDFWEFSESNFQSFSYYNDEYYSTALKNGATWELEKHKHNNVLFFSGSIEHKIKFPARTMFWH